MAIQTNHSTESLKPDSGVLEIDATGALALPAGAETDRPLGAAAGHIRFDQTSTKPEYFDGSVWDKITSKTYVDVGDQSLQNQINNILSNIDPVALDSLTEIVQAFQNSDGSLTDAITALSVSLNTALNQEILDRTTADTALQTNLDAEALARTTGDTTLQTNLNVVEAQLQAQINSILSNLDPATLDSLTEIVNAFQNADTGLLASINNLIAQATADLNQERIERIAADAAETAARITDDAINAAAINVERDRALAAEEVLQDNIDAETLARIAGDTTLQTNLDAVELSLQNNIDAEELARTTADTALQDNIDAEELARTTADTALQNNIDALSLDSLTDVQVTTAPTDGQNLTFDSTIGLFRPKTNALAPITRSFIGNGLTMEFDIIDSVPSPNNLVVVINGIAQQPFYSYTVVDGTRLLFDEAPEANDIIEVRVLKGSATTDRPRPVVSNIAYSTIATFNVVTFNATDITYGTGAKIGNVAIQRIDYPTPNAMQLMFEHSFASGLYDLTLIDTSSNETVYPNLIRIGGGAQWTDSVQFIGSFSGGNTINFSVGVNSGSTLTLGAVASGENTPTWLSVNGLTIVGTAPVNSSPTRYEFEVTANNGSVNITRHYWLVVV